MSQAEVDALDDDAWAMSFNDLVWVRKQEKEKSLADFKKYL